MFAWQRRSCEVTGCLRSFGKRYMCSVLVPVSSEALEGQCSAKPGTDDHDAGSEAPHGNEDAGGKAACFPFFCRAEICWLPDCELWKAFQACSAKLHRALPAGILSVHLHFAHSQVLKRGNVGQFGSARPDAVADASAFNTDMGNMMVL